jgi:hypothetical protein
MTASELSLGTLVLYPIWFGIVSTSEEYSEGTSNEDLLKRVRERYGWDVVTLRNKLVAPKPMCNKCVLHGVWNNHYICRVMRP